MNPQVTTIVLGVSDIDRAKHFYAEGLGCPIEQDQGHFVSFRLGDGTSQLALYPRQALAEDAGVAPDGTGFTGTTFHYIVESPEQVDELLERARDIGAAIAKPAQAAQWGGYFGYFADLDGFLWKVTSPA